MSLYKYTLRPDHPSADETHFFQMVQYAPLPPSADLTAYCGPVKNQGQIGDCSGMASSDLRAWWENKQDHTPLNFSAMYVYAWERIREGDLNKDAGARLQDAAAVLTTQGVAPETIWPTATTTLFSTPTPAANDAALPYKMGKAYRLHGLADVLQAIAQGYPVLLGILVYPEFESPQAIQTGKVPIPQQYDAVLGGHAIVGVAYNLAEQWVKIQNSWGQQVGDQGYFYLPFAYITGGLMSAWVVLPPVVEEPPIAKKTSKKKIV